MQKQTKRNITVNYIEQDLPDDFPITFYKRRPGSINSTRLHFHNGIEIGYCYEGNGLFFVYNKILPYAAGDIVILFPDQPHVAQSAKDKSCDWHFLTFDAERLFRGSAIMQYQPISDIIYNQFHVPNIIRHEQNGDICDVVRHIFMELECQSVGYQHAVKALLHVLLLKLARLADSDAQKRVSFIEFENSFATIVPAIDYITNFYNQPITVQALAKMCFMSERHFARVFLKIMGRSPLEYIVQVKIRMSTMLLKTTSMSISEIALEVGYSSISSFNRHFVKLKKNTPKEYRSKYK